MASYRFLDQVRHDSSPSRQGLSKSQMCLHKILRIIASSAPLPPAGDATASSNQGSSSPLAHPDDVGSERDLPCANRGIAIDLNMEFDGGGEGHEAVSAGSAAEDGNKAPQDSEWPPAAAVKKDEEEFTGSGEFPAVVDRKSSEGECDRNSNKGGGGGGDCSPPAEVSEVQNGSQRRAEEESRVVETASCGEELGGEKDHDNDKGNSGILDRVLIEAADLASGNDSSSLSDPDEIPRTTADEAEEEPESHSPWLRGGIAARGTTKRKRRNNKCWVVDLYRDNSNEMRTATTAAAAAVSKSKRGRRRQVLPSRYRDSSVVMEPWKPPPRRRS